MGSSEPGTTAGVTERVTIVIPVYGDWNSLRACISSVIAQADPATFDVLIVNDCGPDATVIEAGIMAMILNRPTFRYARNPRNLGFVRTCNRAVFELDTTENDVLLLNSDTVLTPGALDEMIRILSLSPWHGAVCPRSNDATIASIPFFQTDRYARRDARRAREVHGAISAELPEYTTAPVAVGFCFLTRRSLIERFGLFDEVFGRGYNEENDYCLRINQQGYSSVLANRAFVEHAGSASFGVAERAALESTNAQTLAQRYPFFPASVVTFIHYGYDAVDRFADLLVPPSQRRTVRLLVDITGCGNDAQAVESTTQALEAFVTARMGLDVDVSVLAEHSQHDLFAFRDSEIALVDPGDSEGIFDAAIVLSPVRSIQQLDRLRRCCLRWILVGDDERPPSTRSTVEDPLGAIAIREGRASADLVLEGPIPDSAVEILRKVYKLSSNAVDRDTLRARDRHIASLVRVWEHESARGNAFEQLLTTARSSLVHRVVGRVARLARGHRNH